MTAARLRAHASLMSASYVRTTFRNWAQQVAIEENVAFYDTVNRTVDPVDAIWWTAVFQAETMQGESYCGPGYIEAGGIVVVAVARAGLGDADVVNAIERVIRGLLARTDPTGKLGFHGYEPVLEETLGSADADYRISIRLDYRFSG